MIFFLLVFAAFTTLLSFLITYFVRILAIRFSITDNPLSNPSRKSQSKSIPLLGGFSVFLITTLTIAFLWLEVKYNILGVSPLLSLGFNYKFKMLYILLGGAIIYFAGFLDDKYNLKPKFYFPLVFLGLAVAVFIGGIKIDQFSYPFNTLNLSSFYLQYILAFVWLGLCLVATKFLDGLDGLVPTVGLINLLTIISIALLPQVFQPFILVASIAFGASILGFLPFNFPNAKMYLGEGGSTIIGFFIGVLSLLAGAKVATVGITIGWFILDIAIVMLLRFLKTGKLAAIFQGDRTHWHHRLINLGLTKIQSLVLSASLLIIASQLGILASTRNKFWIIFTQMLLFFLAFIFSFKERGKNSNTN
jgi:UDP-GlcNAc:undecaprenyl-phosphate/decaprenyl-phosphate GlcNAc-1-phosphate transferase